MKALIISVSFLLVTTGSFSQIGYKKVYKYDENRKDWALVKTISGTYGFIDSSNKVVVQPIYSKIGKFNQEFGPYALVKSIANTYGLIDNDGKEIIPVIYSLPELKEKYKTLSIL